jgi:hypothetical protein
MGPRLHAPALPVGALWLALGVGGRLIRGRAGLGTFGSLTSRPAAQLVRHSREANTPLRLRLTVVRALPRSLTKSSSTSKAL